MRLFNSLSKKVQEFIPLKKGEVGLYTCGPTVYDHIHIGNLRTYIFEDTLRRVLGLNGLKVNHVINITDVDDKTIKRSRQAYPSTAPQIALKKLSRKYETIFLADVAEVGIDLSKSKIARATAHIAEMKILIKKLLANKTAYIANDGIYFSISNYSQRYGVLAKLHSATRSRISNDDYSKHDVADFALWKAKKAKEPAWDFNVDTKNLAGRPGWHIECSAMATKYLGQPFDIHSGGVDLKFPHHENEIAQSQAAAGKPLANYWLHVEHLLINGRKMAKREGNYLTLEQITERGYSAGAFRLLVLQSHYRSQQNFTWKALGSAQNFLNDLSAMADRQFQTQATPSDPALVKLLERVETTILQALGDDLDTPQAIAAIAGVASYLSQAPLSESDAPKFLAALKFYDLGLGLNLASRRNLTPPQKALLKQRHMVRDRGDFKTADELRTQLLGQGIVLTDNPFGATWARLD